MMKFFFIICSFLFSFSVHADTLSVWSPQRIQELKIFVESDGQIKYAVAFKGKTLIHPSTLGFRLKKPEATLNRFVVVSITKTKYDETWKPVWGEVSKIRNNYEELQLNLKDASGSDIQLNIIFRVFDEGIGFRYEFPRQDKLNHFIISDELTQFHAGADHTAFWIPGDYDTNEFMYNTTRLSAVDAGSSSMSQEIYAKTFFDKNAVQTPLLLKTGDGHYISLHEAALLNYPAMNLVIDKSKFILDAHLVPDAIGNKAYLQTPAKTPWRTIIIADQAKHILASKLILNLNEPSKITETSWIKPRKYVGVWWEMHVGKSSWDYGATQSGSALAPHGRHGATTSNVKRYIDFASKHGFDAVLVEGWNKGWEDWFGAWKEDVFDFVTPYPDFDVKTLTSYARAKKVKLIMHHETSASVTNYERWMDTAYRFMKHFGYDAVKTGYVGHIIPRGEHHDGQWMIKHYQRVMEKTASHKIMLNAHEPVRPTGLHRTYPNFLACEAARGNEFNAWSVGNPPEHETILPFTRLMGGPMDYTPGIFRIKVNQFDPNKKEQVHTTLAKQLALYITMYSPLQMAADLPENYEKYPDAFQFIKDVPVDWDDTRVLDAEPGDYIIQARKKKGSNDWYLGAITDENPRNVSLDIDFLDANRTYLVTIYKDGPDAHWQQNPESYSIEKKIFSPAIQRKLDIQLAAGGGCAISFKEFRKGNLTTPELKEATVPEMNENYSPKEEDKKSWTPIVDQPIKQEKPKNKNYN